MTDTPGGESRDGNGWRVALSTLFGALIALHVVAIYRENITGDEWALLARAKDSLESGVLQGAGRPGLGTLILMPLVEGCRDAVATIRTTRWLWTLLTLGYLSGFWMLLRLVIGQGPRTRERLALALGMIVLLPAFLRSSIAVRTDQAALALGLWAGVALVGSQKHAAWGFLAGLLFGTGFLVSQKVVYVAALASVLVVGRLMLRGGLDLRREMLRFGLCAAGGLLVLWGFEQVASRAFELATPGVSGQVQSGMTAFDYYRQTQGYRHYVNMLPTLVPHMLTASLTGIALIAPEAKEHRAELAVAVAILILGMAVGLFHAATFEYFWLTLGLFPAAAAAVALEPIRTVLPSPGMRRALLPALWALLLVVGLPVAVAKVRDTQRVQRESLAFVDRNFPPTAVGFHPERALFCRFEPDPFPVYFSQVIQGRFSGADSLLQVDLFLERVRETPVSFLLDSYRLDQFPQPIRRLFNDAYVPYHGSVMIPGFSFVGPRSTESFEAFVPGTYRWWSKGERATPVRLGDRLLEDGDTITLAEGTHEARWEAGRAGFLLLAVEDPPDPSAHGFYPQRGPSGLFSRNARPGGMR